MELSILPGTQVGHRCVTGVCSPDTDPDLPVGDNGDDFFIQLVCERVQFPNDLSLRFNNTDTFTSSPTSFRFIRYNKHTRIETGPVFFWGGNLGGGNFLQSMRGV